MYVELSNICYVCMISASASARFYLGIAGFLLKSNKNSLESQGTFEILKCQGDQIFKNRLAYVYR